MGRNRRSRRKISIGNTISGDDFEVIGGTWTVDNGAIRRSASRTTTCCGQRRIPDAFEISFEARAERRRRPQD